MAIIHFKFLIQEAFTEFSRPRFSLFELYTLVSNKVLKFSPIQSQILYSPEQIYNSFMKNTSILIYFIMKHVSPAQQSTSNNNSQLPTSPSNPNQSSNPTVNTTASITQINRIIRLFIALIWNDSIFLESITLLLK